MNYNNFVYKLEELVSGGKGAGIKVIKSVFINNKKTSVIFKAIIDALSSDIKEFTHLGDTHKISASVRNAVRHIYSFDMDDIKIMAGRRKGKFDYNDERFKKIVNDLININTFITKIKDIKKPKEPKEPKEKLITYREALGVWNEVNHPTMYCTPAKGSAGWKEVQALRISKKYAV